MERSVFWVFRTEPGLPFTSSGLRHGTVRTNPGDSALAPSPQGEGWGEGKIVPENSSRSLT